MAGYRPLSWRGGMDSMSGGPLGAEGAPVSVSPPRLGALTGPWALPTSPHPFPRPRGGAPGSRSGRAEGWAP